MRGARAVHQFLTFAVSTMQFARSNALFNNFLVTKLSSTMRHFLTLLPCLQPSNLAFMQWKRSCLKVTKQKLA